MPDTGRESPFQGVIGRYAQESIPWWPRPVAATPGRPNVLIIVLDDVGFGHLGCYGSGIETPNMDRLAAGGLRYTNFHAPPMCAPSRASLLTGRNHHSVGMAHNPNWNWGFPGRSGVLSSAAATLPQMLQAGGFNTFAAGKWHLAPLAESSAVGPFHHWPLQKGFERYYGFLDALTDHFEPVLVEDNHPQLRPEREGYHLSEDLVDQSIAMVRDQRSLMPDKPFFLYLAFGACHAPLQAPPAWLAKYRGRFDRGWDVIRQEVYERQLAMGIITPGTELAPRNEGVVPWEELSADDRRVSARFQEAFAAMLDHTDAQIGRLLEYLESIGALENTITILLSDNGAEGSTFSGAFINNYNQVPVDPSENLPNIDKIGGPESHSSYPRGWAQVGNTPLKRYKFNTHGGGVRVPFIVHWPARIKDAGACRGQFHHITDVTPTILEVLGLEAPATYQGAGQMPIHGTSMVDTFDDPGAPTRKRTQYFELMGHRGLWHEGWKAITYHDPAMAFEADRWELYHVDEDFSECHDLAAEQPAKLQEMVERWWIEAGRYDVLPLDPRINGRLSLPPPPGTPAEQRRFRLYAGTSHIPTAAAPDTRNRSYTITAAIERRAPDEEGVIIAHGGITGGYSLFIKDGRLIYEYNRARKRYRVVSEIDVPAGGSSVRMRFDKTADLAGRASLYIDDRLVGSGPIDHTYGGMFALEGLDIGQDSKTAVSDLYRAPFSFCGVIRYVDVELDDDQSDPDA